jgi:hypothetical protein
MNSWYRRNNLKEKIQRILKIILSLLADFEDPVFAHFFFYQRNNLASGGVTIVLYRLADWIGELLYGGSFS